jgi:CMP-N-acetylneuraminic acid synthetase
MTSKIVALLPMKLHSERVKNKNFKKLANKKLYQWILDSLLEVKEIDLIVINTDARELLEKDGYLNSKRVIIRDRVQNLCGDFVSMNKIIEDDLANIESDHFIMTHTTNPLISPETIKNAYKNYINNLDVHDSLFTVNKIQTRFYSEGAIPINHDPDNLKRTQDIEPWYEENSCLYFFNKSSFDKTKSRIGIDPQMFVTPSLESVDIDEVSDWVLAESLALNHTR